MFRLALRLGRTIAELERTLDAAEFAEWAAFDLVEPIGDCRSDIGPAIVAATIANSNRTKESQRAFTAEDMIPQWGKAEIEEAEKRLPRDNAADAEDIKTAMLTWAAKAASQFGNKT